MGVRKIEFWPRQLIRRLLKSSTAPASNGDQSSSDDSLSDFENDGYSPRDVPAMLVRGISETLFSEHVNTQEIRIVAGTWNVAGRSPTNDLDLQEWLNTSVDQELADIYVIGFQEIVPLNAGNVLGAEQDGTANKWENLIRRTLNKVTSSDSSLHRRSVSCESSALNLDSIMFGERPLSKPRRSIRKHFSCSVDGMADGWVTMNSSDEESSSSSSSSEGSNGRFVRIVSKQMVGIFITVWARHQLKSAIRNVKVCCVGCGLMGYLGNKGSISVSMSVHETSFCFICSHLTSGEREGDELRRNTDFTEIMRRTYFHRPKFTWPEMPETIMDHDRKIWLGDLNYRIAISDSQTRLLIAKRDYQTLLRRDQLRMEKMAGRAFDGWQEGSINFPPTYKYVIDTNRYCGDILKPGERRRTPAWCDRILWHGKGVRQLWYGRAESTFSDHKPVSASFLADVEVFEDSKLKSMWTFSKTHAKAKELLNIANVEEQQKHDPEIMPAIAVF